jgi:hypothetical protein
MADVVSSKESVTVASPLGLEQNPKNTRFTPKTPVDASTPSKSSNSPLKNVSGTKLVFSPGPKGSSDGPAGSPGGQKGGARSKKTRSKKSRTKKSRRSKVSRR